MLSSLLQNKLQSDSQYWTRLKNGDPDALGYFYDHYVDELFRYAVNMTGEREMAKDALQEVFLQLWNYRNSISEVTNTQAYLQKVLRNVILKKYKKDIPYTYNVLDRDFPCLQENIEQVIICTDTNQENAGKLKRALSTLTKRQKIIIQLHFYEGLTYKQIAERLCMNHQSVNNLVFRTMLRLRSQMYQLALIVLFCLGR